MEANNIYKLSVSDTNPVEPLADAAVFGFSSRLSTLRMKAKHKYSDMKTIQRLAKGQRSLRQLIPNRSQIKDMEFYGTHVICRAKHLVIRNDFTETYKLSDWATSY